MLSTAALRPLPSWVHLEEDGLAVAVVLRALAYIGECEEPASSNRGPMVDEWNRRRGAPLGSYWCASFATSMWADCDAETAGVGRDPSCDQLMQWCVKTSRFSKAPTLGALIFYGVPGDAKHVGIVIRTAPYLVTVEGNAAWGGAFTSNGECVITRRPDPKSASILGFASLRSRLPAAA